MTNGYTLGLDVSFWQNALETPCRPDFGVAYSAGARFIFHRIGQGQYADPDFAENWKNAKAAGLLVGGYWFYDYRYPITEQFNRIAETMGCDHGDLPVVFDLERVPTWESGTAKYVPLPPTANLYRVMEQFVDLVMEWDGRPPILYTNQEFLLYIVNRPPAKVLTMPLWVACYAARPPAKLGAWKEWKFWQSSSHGDGRKFGMESGNVDLDYYCGSYADLLAFAGKKPPAPVDSWEKSVTKFLRTLGYNGPDPAE